MQPKQVNPGIHFHVYLPEPKKPKIPARTIPVNSGIPIAHTRSPIYLPNPTTPRGNPRTPQNSSAQLALRGPANLFGRPTEAGLTAPIAHAINPSALRNKPNQGPTHLSNVLKMLGL